jgi:hypothetical protein
MVLKILIMGDTFAAFTSAKQLIIQEPYRDKYLPSPFSSCSGMNCNLKEAKKKKQGPSLG